ncbi:hypothetical protein R1flu_010132 [Riccia fluitans]|uniref:SAP domain-containing protein n=1 Tax=Riccia fluitans TaxID=41844 RepID=A0ABD1Z4W7_9MARC
MDTVEKEASKKCKAAIQTIFDFDTETEPEEEKEPPKEVSRVFCEGEASGSKPLDLKVDFAEWGNRVESFNRETGRLFEVFHVEFGSVTAEAVARNLKEMFAPPPVVETDLQPWKEMVRTLVDLLTEEQKRIKLVVEQRDYFEGKNRCSEKIPEIAMWSGYHGTLPVINTEDDKVIEMVTLTRSERGSSWKIETQALELALKILQDKGITIGELKEYCREHDLPQSGSKLQLVQRVSVHLKLPEAGASPEIQRQRPLKYPELAAHDIAYKLKSWIYMCVKNAALRGDTTPGLLTMDIHNAADHWAGDHTTCLHLPGVRKCVVEKWTGGKEAKYLEGGETYKAVKEFLKKYIMEIKMKCYIRARENFISETFHRVINKFATKRIHLMLHTSPD